MALIHLNESFYVSAVASTSQSVFDEVNRRCQAFFGNDHFTIQGIEVEPYLVLNNGEIANYEVTFLATE